MKNTYQFLPTCFIFTLWAAHIEASCDGSVSYRLPGDIFPDYYQLEIVTNLADLDQNFTFTGNVWIKVRCFRSTNKIILHSKNLMIDENEVIISLLGSSDGGSDPAEVKFTRSCPDCYNVKIAGHCYHEEYELYIIELAEMMNSGYSYSILIPYSGELTQGLAGYYRSSYKDKTTGQTKWLAVTQFESTDARRALPCFDEPAYKAKFQVNLGHADYRTSISNMPISSTVPIQNMPGWVWDHYLVTVPMSTYLLAFVISDFTYKMSPASPDSEVLFKTWARKDAINQVDYAAIIGPQILSYFERYFSVKYPLPKLDMVAIPDFSAGAMENWGLITFREVALLYDPRISAATSQPYVASVIAHELAHQWFGNLVTMNWWTDLWLNEGFATYVAALGVNYVHPEWHFLDEEAVENMMSVFAVDSLKSSHPISMPIGHPREISQIFDTISYKKGSFVLRMINMFLTEKVFRKGVTNYLKIYAYNNAEQDDLWQSLTEEAHRSKTLSLSITVKEIMDSWTLQTGYPLITIIRNYQECTATVYQERFFADRGNNKDSAKTRWWVPLSYTTASEGNFDCTTPKAWLPSTQSSIILSGIPCADWVIFNLQIGGLYRIKYDEENWNRLTSALLTNHCSISLLNRVQLIEDSLELGKTGDIDYSIPFNILDYLQQEVEYLPWKTALRNLGFIDKMLRFFPTYSFFRAYMRKLLTNIYHKTSRETYPESPEYLNKIKLQSLIASWACKYEVGDCKERAVNYFRSWMCVDNPDFENPIPKDYRGHVYCTAIKFGGEIEWTFLWHRYVNSNVGNERSVILSALTCTREIWILNRLLEWTLGETTEIRKQDSPAVFAGVARGDVGFGLAKNFLMDRLADIYDYFGAKSTRLGSYVSVLASQIVDLEDFNDLREFTQLNGEFFCASQQAVQQGLENAKINIQWHQMFYSSFTEILQCQL